MEKQEPFSEYRTRKMYILPGNVVLDLDDITVIYAFKRDSTSFRIHTKSAGLIIVSEKDLHAHNKNITLLSAWYGLVHAVTGAEGDWNTPGEAGMSILTNNDIRILGKETLYGDS